MSEHNSFERILQRLDEADMPTEKTAEESQPEPSAQARMLSIVQNITTKTASETPHNAEGNPVDDLTKLANDAQAAEEQHLVKQAQFLGAALADGFMERFAQYDAALAAGGAKTASVQPAANASREQLQAAYQQGIKEAQDHADASYRQGYSDQMQAVHKVAADLHYSGQLLANQVVEDAKSSNAGE